MSVPVVHNLPKRERLSGKNNIAALLKKGRYGSVSCLKYCFTTTGEDCPRIMISVPKRSFRRAVRRNLLRRRIRESFRLQKELIPAGFDIMFVYTSREILPFSEIYAAMGESLRAIAVSDNAGK